MATFGEFSVARMGIIASQFALNVTGQNISNINTPGYTRQQLDQYSFISNGSGVYRSDNVFSVGQGVMVSGVSQLRNPYLDIRFRKEMSSVGSTDALLSGLEQIQSVINDVNKSGLTEQLQELYQRISDLMQDNNVNEQEFDTLVRSSAEELCKLLNMNAGKLEEAYENVMNSYKEDIDGLNETLERIQKLTEQIRVADINGDSALELRDQRNLLIDDLSQYMKIDVTYGTEDVGAGFEIEKLTIKVVDNATGKPGQTLIDGIYRAEVTLPDMIKDKNGNDVANDRLLLNIGELFSPDGKDYISNTKFSFEASGINIEPGSAGGPQTITISYKDAAGAVHKQDIFFEVAPLAADATAEQIEAARKATMQKLNEEIRKNSELSNLFTLTARDHGFLLTSKGTGAGAAEITGIDLSGSDITFASTKPTEAVDSNQGVIAEGSGYGALESTRQMLVGEGEFTADGTVDTRGIPYYMKSLDMLANKFATEMNRINTTGPDGQPLKSVDENGNLVDNKKAGYLFVAEDDNPDNPTKTITASNISLSSKWMSGETQMVAAITTSPDQTTQNDNLGRFLNALNAEHVYTAFDIVRDNSTNFATGQITYGNGAHDGDSLTAQITYIDSMNQEHTVTVDFFAGTDAASTLKNLETAIKGSKEMQDANFLTIQNQTGHLDISADGDEDSLCNVITNLEIVDPKGNISISEGKIESNVSMDSIYKGTIEGSYSNMQGVLGSDYNTTAAIYDTYATSADELNNSRDSVSGVDLNDEGINLMTYQKAFAAACRLMTTLDEAMDKVINGMGIVGR